jgi:serine/threonine protein kinase
LWSVAVILYKMLTGNAPFPGTNTGDVMVRVCTDSCAPPSSFVPGLSRAVDAFFVRAVTRDPAGRFQSAQELADAIVTAVSTPATHQPPKWAKTLPLLPINAAALKAAIEAESGASGQPPRPRQPSVYPNGAAVPATPEMAPGTFQAVTMSPAQLMGSPGTAIAAPKPPSNVTKGVVMGVAFAVAIISLVVGILRMQKSSAPDESAQAAPGSIPSVIADKPNSAVSVQPMANPQSSSVSSARAPLPATASTTASPLQPAKTTAPATTAPAATVPKPVPLPRTNPLDIND